MPAQRCFNGVTRQKKWRETSGEGWTVTKQPNKEIHALIHVWLHSPDKGAQQRSLRAEARRSVIGCRGQSRLCRGHTIRVACAHDACLLGRSGTKPSLGGESQAASQPFDGCVSVCTPGHGNCTAL